MPTTPREPRAVVAAALWFTLAVGYALALDAEGLTTFAGTAVANLGQLVAAAAAAGCCWLRSRDSTGRLRLSWLLFAAATGSWAFAQLLRTGVEFTAPLPFPSWPHVGFLLFSVLAVFGLLVRLTASFARRLGLRTVLDALMIAGSLAGLLWVTSLGETYRVGASSTTAHVTALAYPVLGLILVSVAVLVLAHARLRPRLLLMAGGMIVLAIADSTAIFGSATGSASGGYGVDVARVAAFALVGFSATVIEDQSRSTSAWWHASAGRALPFALVPVGVGAMLFDGQSQVARLAALVALAALILRQLVLLRAHRRLQGCVASQQEDTRRRASHDQLTGLANRALFNERLEHALALHRRNARAMSLLFCDLDDFKTVNDTLGHDAGDLLLIEVASRLKAITRPGDTVARLGGDEFAILVEDDADAGGLATRLLDEALTTPVRIAGRNVPARFSIGVATLTAGELTVDSQEFVRRADAAMYAAKRKGKARAVPYVHVIGRSADHDLDLQLALAQGITGGGLRAALQPVYSVQGELRGYEALARWRYRDQSVPPDVFIPIAERAGLLPRLDIAVIDQAITAVAAQPAPTFVSVNIGIRHLATPGVAAEVAALMKLRGLPAHRLVVEVPEDQDISDPEVMATLHSFRLLGVRLAMDDFGAGYSSLSRIYQIEPEIIKLDRSFVTPLDEPGHRTDVIAGIIDLAHRVGAIVIAEGVETRTQLETLTALGCDGVQGNLLGRPEEIVPQPRDVAGSSAVVALHEWIAHRSSRSA